jgi:hypothetical protein
MQPALLRASNNLERMLPHQLAAAQKEGMEQIGKITHEQATTGLEKGSEAVSSDVLSYMSALKADLPIHTSCAVNGERALL